jgi:6-phosphogluconolactonase
MMQLIVGGYTEEMPFVRGQADGVLTAAFDADSGRIGPVSTAAVARNPSYLVRSASGERLYTVNETRTFAGQPGGGVSAYARDPGTGALTPLNSRPSLGDDPCFITLDPAQRFALVANYGVGAGSVTVYQLEPDGRLGAVTDHVEHAGSGPVPGRQENSHAHMIAADPVTGDIFVADLGSDAIRVYALGHDGRLVAKDGSLMRAAPGAGPRHLAFHPDGRHLFVVNELDSTVSVLRRDGERFAVAGQASTLPAAAGPDRVAGPDSPAGPGNTDGRGSTSGPGNTSGLGNTAAALRVTPSGRHVLASNRGHDSIAVLRFAPGTAELSLVGHAASAGATPRDFVVTPDGRHVIVAGQDNDTLASHAFDDDAGTLRLLHTVSAPTPVCLLLA